MVGVYWCWHQLEWKGRCGAGTGAVGDIYVDKATDVTSCRVGNIG